MIRRMILVFAFTGIFGLFVPEAHTAVTNAQSQFRFEFMESDGHRGQGVEGYVYNGLPWTITNVRLRVESLDHKGTVTAEASGWVTGDVRAGGRGYFFVPVSSHAAAYRATVESFNKVAREASTIAAP